MIEAPHIELESLSLSAAREKGRTGEVSAGSLAEKHFERIAAIDGEIHSFLALTKERALEQAARVDAAPKAGEPLGPLAGVPVGIKDVLTTRGVETTAGSKILKGYHPPYDATAVARMEAAGAVVLGKLNCDEFAMGSSNENSAYGPVHNPRALDRVPGGSSGGSAASVAAGLCVTSLERVGPLARSVEDAATVLEVIAGKDACDATSSELPVGSYVNDLKKPVTGLKIGVPEEYVGEGLSAEIRATVERALDYRPAA